MNSERFLNMSPLEKFAAMRAINMGIELEEMEDIQMKKLTVDEQLAAKVKKALSKYSQVYTDPLHEQKAKREEKLKGLKRKYEELRHASIPDTAMS